MKINYLCTYQYIHKYVVYIEQHIYEFLIDSKILRKWLY